MGRSITILVAGEMLFVHDIETHSHSPEMSKPEDIGKNMGILNFMRDARYSCGPLLGGFLLDRSRISRFFVWGADCGRFSAAAVGFLFWRGYIKNRSKRGEIGDGVEKRLRRRSNGTQIIPMISK